MIEVAPGRRFPSQEIDLLDPLLAWLRGRGFVRDDSLVVSEFGWHGRRVDLAVLTRSGRATAFELKLRHNRRVLEQGALNAVTFDRSFVVTATRPSAVNLDHARALGVGVLLVSLEFESVSLLIPAEHRQVHASARRTLRVALRAKSEGS